MIYLDNAATTKMCKEATETYKKYAEEVFFNPSAPYNLCLGAVKGLEDARAEIAYALNAAKKEEIIFTGSGTEADNLALFGTPKRKGSKILIGGLEHSAVYKSALELKARGFEVVFLPVDNFGRVIFEEFQKELSANVSLISVMHVNNETGAVNDIEKMAKLSKKMSPNAKFHSDGVQAFLKIPTDMKKLSADMYSISAHKVHGPKGVGALYLKSGVSLNPVIFGGGQEYTLRSGTENVAGIAAFSAAVKKYGPNFMKESERQFSILKYLYKALCENSGVVINTDIEACAPHILNFSIKDARGEVVVHELEEKNIILGTGSACNFAAKGGDRVSKTLHAKKGFEHGFLRVSLGTETTKKDIETLIKELKISK